MIIEKDCKKQIHVSNRMNLSSNINEGIRAGFFLFFFFVKRFYTHEKHKKHKKHKKQKKAQNVKEATFLLLDILYAHKKHKKHEKHKTSSSDFLPCRCFYVHKNTAFFVSHTKKHKKHIKSIKTQISE